MATAFAALALPPALAVPGPARPCAPAGGEGGFCPGCGIPVGATVVFAMLLTLAVPDPADPDLRAAWNVVKNCEGSV